MGHSMNLGQLGKSSVVIFQDFEKRKKLPPKVSSARIQPSVSKVDSTKVQRNFNLQQIESFSTHRNDSIYLW